MTDPAAAAVVVSIIALAGTGVNVWLSVRISNAVLRSERRIMNWVADEHPTREVFNIRMAEHRRRLEALENHHA